MDQNDLQTDKWIRSRSQYNRQQRWTMEHRSQEGRFNNDKSRQQKQYPLFARRRVCNICKVMRSVKFATRVTYPFWAVCIALHCFPLLAQANSNLQSKCRLSDGRLIPCTIRETESRLGGRRGYLRSATVRSDLVLQSFVEYDTGKFLVRKNNDDWKWSSLLCENISEPPWRMQVYMDGHKHLFSIGAECGD